MESLVTPKNDCVYRRGINIYIPYKSLSVCQNAIIRVMRCTYKHIGQLLWHKGSLADADS